MAEDSENQEVQEQESKKLLGNKYVLATAVFLLCVGIGAPIGYFLVPHAPEDISQDQEVLPVEEEHEEPMHTSLVAESDYDEITLMEGEEAPGAIAPFDTFLANLVGGKYIRLQVQIEFTTPDVPSRLNYKLVAIRDSILTHLTEQSAEELYLPSGKKRLKEEIRKTIDGEMRGEVVRNVFFTQFVIQ